MGSTISSNWAEIIVCVSTKIEKKNKKNRKNNWLHLDLSTWSKYYCSVDPFNNCSRQWYTPVWSVVWYCLHNAKKWIRKLCPFHWTGQLTSLPHHSSVSLFIHSFVLLTSHKYPFLRLANGGITTYKPATQFPPPPPLLDTSSVDVFFYNQNCSTVNFGGFDSVFIANIIQQFMVCILRALSLLIIL